ncbi:MAG: hypothetical protein ABUS79_18300, partial [Pseudomonadota bacterium]
FDRAYHDLVVVPVRDFARAAAWLDRCLFDPLVDACAWLGMRLARAAALIDDRLLDAGVDGVSRLILLGGRRATRLQSGRIGAYVAGLAAGAVVLALVAYILVS